MPDPTPADHPNGPWRSIPAPQSGFPWLTDGPAVPESREPASVASEATGQPRPLSPAAQAVLDAFVDAACGPTYEMRQGVAAALCAAADQVAPQTNYPMDSPWGVGFADRDAQLRRDLLAIAAELGGLDG